MAEYKVSTWKDFVNAYTAEAAAGETERTIEIMADLDCNDMPFSNPISNPANVKVTINGNQHNIWNISTESVVNSTLIRVSSNKIVTWNKVNFGNINRIENYDIFSGNSSAVMEFYDCTFVGKGYSLANSSKFYRCAITWTGRRVTGNFSATVYYYNCWLHFEIVYAKQNTHNIEFYNLDSSYLEGKFDGADDTIKSAGPIAVTINNSVINMDSNLTRSRIAQGCTYVSVFNKTKMPNSASDNANLIGVTDDQMKDANYLSSIGFNIITG